MSQTQVTTTPDTTDATIATVAEIVTFRLIEGTDPAAFITAARALEPMLKASGTVLSRTLSCDDTDTWTDHITWTTMAAATSTAEAMMADPLAAPMMQLIDPAHVTMRHAPIAYQQE
ncbi:hypothetical protein [Sulfitobacter geojensis]|uniref:ABM domain-containing protein n=1 Tax=Sulfitobacter geojensis TaxID=1342299 RepID=A0AAE2VVM6_9RHOB|nr:hypothetical protein [Sulfitobacter geojensis]MBM1687954.1 hypothetical protein [Sulfitobacter geojensis]MBM1692021.1 hypothetical protein [Sulfitobacter geojensis]MBM1704187.1 hypothetical protein [Sulfitobacter geojensis]MBM1708245.1 hypothetical protein [Sulfitobacter geojensis]MBM1712310.1 hypothetical protein [Sulfitobacter geojensis]